MNEEDYMKSPIEEKYPNIIGTIRTSVLAEIPKVKFIGIVGSVAARKEGRFSDFDVVVITDSVLYNKKYFKIFDDKLLQIDVIGRNFFNELINKKTSLYRVYVEANRFSNVITVYIRDRNISSQIKRLVKNGLRNDVIVDNIDNLYAHILERRGKILNAAHEKNKKALLFSSRIIAEYTAWLLFAYNKRLLGSERSFFIELKKLKFHPKNFAENFDVCMWSSNDAKAKKILRSVESIVGELDYFLSENPAKLKYDKEFTCLLSSGNIYGKADHYRNQR